MAMDKTALPSPTAAVFRRHPTSALRREPVRLCIDSQQLFHGQRELVISHNGDHYHLRITRNRKLILTK